MSQPQSLEDFNFDMAQETQHGYNDLHIGGCPEEVEEGEVDAGGCDEDVQVQSTVVGKYARVPRPNAKRQKNFKPEEDEIIVSAWLNASKDPVHGANQTLSSFWRRIVVFYDAHRGSYPSRTESSFMHRWMYIQENVNKFCLCYVMVQRRNQSGTTITDKVSEALTMFKGLNKGKSFTLLQCWNMLKGEDKWKAKMKEIAEQKRAARNRKKVQNNSTPTNAEVNNNEVVPETQAPQAPEPKAPKRPQGVKKAKEVARPAGC